MPEKQKEELEQLKQELNYLNGFIEREERKKSVSGLESFARGLGQGVTAGGSDELTALIKKLDGNQGSLADEQENLRLAEEANPGLYTAGDVLGSVALGLMPLPGTGPLAALKAASSAQKFGRAGLWALEGATNAALRAKEGEREKEAIIGAMTGLAGGAALQSLFSTVKKHGSNLIKIAMDGKLGEEWQRKATMLGLKMQKYVLRHEPKTPDEFFDKKLLLDNALAEVRTKFDDDVFKAAQKDKGLWEVLTQIGNSVKNVAKESWPNSALQMIAPFYPAMRGLKTAVGEIPDVVKTVGAAGFQSSNLPALSPMAGSISQSLFNQPSDNQTDSDQKKKMNFP